MESLPRDSQSLSRDSESLAVLFPILFLSFFFLPCLGSGGEGEVCCEGFEGVKISVSVSADGLHVVTRLMISLSLFFTGYRG